MKKAFLTGVTGQDGSYLAELLLEKGYEVHSIMRRASVFTSARIDHLVGKENFIIHRIHQLCLIKSHSNSVLFKLIIINIIFKRSKFKFF